MKLFVKKYKSTTLKTFDIHRFMRKKNKILKNVKKI